jgi:hypothetical protein
MRKWKEDPVSFGSLELSEEGRDRGMISDE